MTRTDILAKVKRNELSIEEGEVLLEKLEKMNSGGHHPVQPQRNPPRFQVAEKSGWCSVYFDGMWRPCTLPSKLWLELLEEDNIERFKQFLTENKSKFRDRK